jgi:hypothetical protein
MDASLFFCNNKSLSWWPLISLLLGFCSSVVGLNIISPNYLVENIDTPQLFGPNYINNVTTRVQIVQNCCSKCGTLNNVTFPTSAFAIPGNCALEDISRNAQRAGYVACFIVAIGVTSEAPGTLYFRVDGSNQSNILIPVFELSASDFAPLQAAIINGTQVLVNVTFGNPNQWVAFYTGPAGIVFAAIFVPVSAALAIFALVKLIIILKGGMKVLSVPIFALAAEFAASIIRGIVAIDVIGAFRLLIWGAHTILFTLNIPLTISATILIAFYWNEMITSFKVSSTVWLQKFQVPFWIVCVALILLDLAFGLLRVFYVVVDLFVTILSNVYSV